MSKKARSTIAVRSTRSTLFLLRMLLLLFSEVFSSAITLGFVPCGGEFIRSTKSLIKATNNNY
jgi:hypothetical protein